MWIAPVFDRTQVDVDYAKDNRSYHAQLKGAQGSVAWNRLTGNMYNLAELLNNYGYQITLHSKYNWIPSQWVNGVLIRGADIPTVAEIQQIKYDLALLRYNLLAMMNYSWVEFEGFNQTWTMIDTRNRRSQDYFSKNPLPELPWTHFEKINDVEEIIYALKNTIQSIKQLFRFSGTFSAGQLSYLPHFIETEREFMNWIEFDQLQRTWSEIDAEFRMANDFFRRI